MKKSYIFALIVLYISIWIIGYIYYPKINYHSFLINTLKEKQLREQKKSEILQKEIILYIKNYNYKQRLNLNIYKDYFTINGDFCDINDNFFAWIESDLKKKNILYKPKISFDEKNIWSIKVLKYGKNIAFKNLKYNICSFIHSSKKIDSIEIETQNYSYSKTELKSLTKYKLVWSYTIQKYFKTPVESIQNSELLINSISNELIYPGENISVLENLLKKSDELKKSNILKDGEIIKWIWWGSCLASSIIYRTLLQSWIEIKSQKTHNIYYENIYGTWEIGLDSTIYEDEKYFVDLLFENNYSSPIVFIPEFTSRSIILKVYALQKEYFTKLTPIDIQNSSNIVWKYEVFNKKNLLIKEENIISKYDKVDSF